MKEEKIKVLALLPMELPKEIELGNSLECRGIPCEIAPFVMVNHWGTIILAEPLELPDDGRRYIDEETDWDYSPLEGKGTANHKPCTTISDFMTAYVH